MPLRAVFQTSAKWLVDAENIAVDTRPCADLRGSNFCTGVAVAKCGSGLHHCRRLKQARVDRYQDKSTKSLRHFRKSMQSLFRHYRRIVNQAENRPIAEPRMQSYTTVSQNSITQGPTRWMHWRERSSSTGTNWFKKAKSCSSVAQCVLVPRTQDSAAVELVIVKHALKHACLFQSPLQDLMAPCHEHGCQL